MDKKTTIKNYFSIESLIQLDVFHELIKGKRISRPYLNFKEMTLKLNNDGTIVIENVGQFKEVIFSPLTNDLKKNELGERILLNYLIKIKNFDLISKTLKNEEIERTDINKMVISFECNDEKTFLKNKLKISGLDRKNKLSSKIVKENGFMTLTNDELETQQLYDYVIAIKNH